MAGIITITPPGVDARSATDKQAVLSTKYPLHKLDKTKPISFQNIRIFFSKDPPNPDGISNQGPTTTLIDSFPHGYTYTPATWFLMQNISQAGPGLKPAFQQEGGNGTINGNEAGALILLSNELDFTAAYLRMNVDATNVSLYVDKWYDNRSGLNPNPANIAAYSILVRLYVFVEDLT